MSLPAGIDCCCDGGPAPCPAPARCGWWEELCCDLGEGEQFRDCWPATGWAYGPGSTVTIDLTVWLSLKTVQVYRCPTAGTGTIAAIGLYPDGPGTDCSDAIPRSLTPDEVAVSWHARKRLLVLSALTLAWSPSSGCTGFGWRARAHVNIADPGTIAVTGSESSWTCGSRTHYADCDLGTQTVYCDITFTPRTRGGWTLRVVPVSGPFPDLHELPLTSSPNSGGGTSEAAPSEGHAGINPASWAGLEVDIEHTGCLWSWGGGRNQGQQTYATTAQSGEVAGAGMPPTIPSGITETTGLFAWSRLRAVQVSWRISKILVADPLCGYDCSRLPYMCNEPDTYLVTIERQWLGGVQCEGGCRQCLLTCTTSAILHWCSGENRWLLQVIGETGGASGDGCRKLVMGEWVDIDEGCDELGGGISGANFVQCGRDPTNPFFGEFGWIVTGSWAAPLTISDPSQVPFVPFSEGIAPVGSWEITASGELCDDECGAPTIVEQFVRLTIEA